MDFLFSDFSQSGRVLHAESAAESARESASEAEHAANEVQRRIEVMALANQALFEILKSRLGITEEEVVARMADIDARDGTRDGKMTATVTACRSCGRKISTARRRCLFCGETALAGNLFQKT